MHRVLLIGATGAFGSRLAKFLSRIDGIELVLAGRTIEPLSKLRDELNATGAAHVSALVFDRSSPGRIGQIAPWLVVDAAGPFQDSDYRLPLATVTCGAHYIDLSDGRKFVADFPAAVDGAAQAHGVLALTGASSTPALSHAVLTALVAGWTRIDDVMVVISPGARAPRGLSVVQAILGYAGQPVRVFDAGHWQRAFGWSGARRIDMPGLGKRWASICETPDLDLLPKNFLISRSALFLAGLELPVMHLGLSAFSYLARWGLIRSLRSFARPLRALAGLLERLGTDRGGMIVQASGRDDQDRAVTARWSLLAEENAGPNVPVAAAAALIRALHDRGEAPAGAQACVGLLTCGAILHELSELPIFTRTDESFPDSPVLFRRLLGRRIDRLPASVMAVHDIVEGETFNGNAAARCGRRLPVRLLNRLIGLPTSGRYPVIVTIVPDAHGETWLRRFGASQFSSRLMDHGGVGLFEECFGPVRFVFDLETTSRGMRWQFLNWSILGIPMPGWLAPRIRATAQDRNERYQFSVAVAHAWLGLLFAYRGTLERSTVPTTDNPGG